MWPQLVNVALGLWLMAAPAVLGYGRPASTSDHIVGPLIATFACMALCEVMRAVRWVNLPLGIWLLAAPWLLDAPFSGRLSSMLTGTAVAVFSCFGGTVRQRFGGGWAALWRDSAAD